MDLGYPSRGSRNGTQSIPDGAPRRFRPGLDRLALPHAAGGEVGNRLRKSLRVRELAHTLTADAEQVGDLRETQELHAPRVLECVNSLAYLDCVNPKGGP